MKLFLLIALTTLISCESESQRFVHRYQTFTTNLITNHKQLTPAEWDSTRVQYKVLRKEAELYKPNLTQAEQTQIDSCNYKINALIIRNEVNGVVGEVENIINELSGTIKELMN